MLRFFTILTGDRYSLVKQHGPASRKKIIAKGTGLLLVTGLWLFTGYNLGTTALGLGGGFSMAMCFALAACVFMLDRIILLAGEDAGLIGGMRVVLAICMALVGGTGIDLCLLRSEIDQTLVSVHQERMDERLKLVRDGHASELAEAGALVVAARKAKEIAEGEWLAELNGAPRGTGRYGNGSVARAKAGLVNARTVELDQAESLLAGLKEKERADIATTQSQLATAQDVPALFDRIDAMHRYVLKDRLVLVGYILVNIILVLFELAPLMAKWGMGTTAYELESRIVDEMQRERVTTQHLQLIAHHQSLRKLSHEQRQASLVMQQAQISYTRALGPLSSRNTFERL